MRLFKLTTFFLVALTLTTFFMPAVLAQDVFIRGTKLPASCDDTRRELFHLDQDDGQKKRGFYKCKNGSFQAVTFSPGLITATDGRFNVSLYASFQAAVSSIGSTPATLSWSTDQAITGALTIPSNIELRPINGAILTAGGQVVINGTLTAPPDRQVFARSGPGKILFGPTFYAPEITPQLFGAKAGDSFDDYSYFLAMNEAIENIDTTTGSAGIPVHIPRGSYISSQQIKIRYTGSWTGDGGGAWGNTTINFNANVGGIEIQSYSDTPSNTKRADDFTLSNIRLQGPSAQALDASNPTGGFDQWKAGLTIRAHGVTVENVYVYGFLGDGIFVNSSNRTGSEPETNANDFSIKKSAAYFNHGSGFRALGGPNTNAGRVESFKGSGNGHYGVEECSFLGNTYDAGLLEGNKLGAYDSCNGGVASNVFINPYAESDQSWGRWFNNASVTNGSPTLTTATEQWTAEDVGAFVMVEDSTHRLRTHVIAFVDEQHVTLAVAPTWTAGAIHVTVKGSGRTDSNGVVVNGNTTVEDSSMNWTSADAGRDLFIYRSNGTYIWTSIQSVVDPTHVVVGTAPDFSGSGVRLVQMNAWPPASHYGGQSTLVINGLLGNGYKPEGQIIGPYGAEWRKPFKIMDTGSGVFTGNETILSQTPNFYVGNFGAASPTVPNQYSPYSIMQGSAYNSTSSAQDTYKFRWQVTTANGASTKGYFNLTGTKNDGSPQNLLQFDEIGLAKFFGGVQLQGFNHADLGTPTAGTIKWCADCDPGTTPCGDSGAGAWAFGNGVHWICPF